jgi:hypothetical protein
MGEVINGPANSGLSPAEQDDEPVNMTPVNPAVVRPA